MKFTKIVLAVALMIAGVSVNAQETEQVEFKPHMFLQIQGGGQYTLGESDFGKLLSPNAQIALGYQFNPVWALRLAVNGWQSKGGFTDNETYKWNYVAPGLDVKFNIVNAIGGYNPNRIFGLNLIVGAAANIGFNNDEEFYTYSGHYLGKYWDGTCVNPVGRAGLDLDFRVSKRVSLNLEAMSNFTLERYNSKADYEKANADWYFNALLGVKIALGATEKVTRAAEPVIIEEPAPAPVKPEPKPTPKPKPVVKKAPEMQTEIFYEIRETVIPASEQGKINNLIAFLKANPETKVNVTGFADAGTGNPKINMKYSEGRAANVVKALTDAGIDAARINMDAKGDTVQPFSENDKNRVTIAIAK